MRTNFNRHNEENGMLERKKELLLLLGFLPSSSLFSSSTSLWMFLLMCSCCFLSLPQYAYAMAYSVKSSNCYDIKTGFASPKQMSKATNGGVTGAGVGGGNISTFISGDLMAGNRQLEQNRWQQYNQFNQQSTTLGTLTEVYGPGGAAIVSGWKCCCWNATDEVECRCEGDALTRIPQTLTVPVQRLTITSAGLQRLRSTGLKVYAASLLDIVLTDLKQLDCIEDGAFASPRFLRTIYISHAPKLIFLSKNVFHDISDTIKIIRIINSGLMQIPDLINLPPENILQMIDLDNNQITRINSNSIKIKTDQLILANNEISYIDDSAFSGSLIANLILKENRKLQKVHPNAFNGTNGIQLLDLSGTSLVRLPSAGLQDIEELRIENTHTLKTIPSIYNFKNLQRAYLTHSFHCCAFKFPSRHDPQRHAERIKEIEKYQRKCIKAEQNNNDIGEKMSHYTFTTSTSNYNKFAHRMIMKESVDDDDDDDEVKFSSVQRQSRQIQNNNTNSNGVNINLPLENSARKDDIIYRRLKRMNFALSNKLNETEAVWDIVDNDEIAAAADANDNGNNDDGNNYEEGYSSDTFDKESGTFHETITINPAENQIDEYCGNFTFRKSDVECYPMPNALNPCEDVMGYQWLRISVWAVVALAVIGNVAVLVVILSIKSESASVPRFLMCHLAFADLCLGLYLLLIASIDGHSMGEYFNFAYDWQYGAGCKLAGFLTVFASNLSVYTLTVITIERWLAITHALYLNKRIKLRQAACIMVGGWIYSIVMSLLPLFGISNYSSTSICLPMEIRDLFDVVYLVSILGINGIAFFIIAICYAQIYLSLGKETRHAHHTHLGEMTVAKKMALLVFTNFSCWAPIAFFGLTALAGYPLINVTKSKILLVFFYPLNSCADPYLYAILTSQYRQDLYTLLSKFGICKQSALKYKHSLSTPVTTNYTMQRNSLTIKSPPHQTQLQQHQQQCKIPETQLMLKNHEDFV